MTRLGFLKMLGAVPMVARYGSMGQMHRRPDQQTDAPPTAVAPSQAAGTLRARTVIIFGTGGHAGLFVYNGAPAKGNLVAQIVAPGVTSDPFGNAVSAVANFGHWNASGALLNHFGIDASGNTYLANTSGLTVVFENSSDGSIQFYNTSGAGLGNLVASIAPASGTDPSGNSYVSGIASYSSAGVPLGRLVSSSLQFELITSLPNFPPSVQGPNASAAGTSLLLQSGKGTAGATGVAIDLLDSLEDAALGGTGVTQVVINAGVAANPLTSALLEVQGTIQTTGLNGITAAGGFNAGVGNVDVPFAGSGLRVAEGSNAKQGTATLAGGTKLVANTSITASSRIFLTAQDNNSTGALRVSARTAGTSFTITSSNAADSGVIAFEIFEPG